jgi:hypothetical protein
MMMIRIFVTIQQIKIRGIIEKELTKKKQFLKFSYKNVTLDA